MERGWTLQGAEQAWGAGAAAEEAGTGCPLSSASPDWPEVEV